MKALMCVVLSGSFKNYAVPKFLEMLDCLAISDHCDVVFAVDYIHPEIDYPQIVVPSMSGSQWATEIVYHGKWELAEYAEREGYSHVIWQGIDCYYASPEDLPVMLSLAGHEPIVGALVAGRDKLNYPVCRDFIQVPGKLDYSHHQREIDPLKFDYFSMMKVDGYIGSDATVIRTSLLRNLSMDGYIHWHHLRTADALGPEEYFAWKAVNAGFSGLVCTEIRPWHAHETGRAVRYNLEEKDLADISWS